MKKIFFTVLTLILCLTGGCHSHKDHDDHDHDHNPVHNHGESASSKEEDEEEAHNPDEIILTPEKAKAAGVVVEAVVPTDFNAVIKTGGKVLTASGDESTIVAPSAGIISMKKGYTEGMAIAKGTPLMTLSSSKLPEGDLSRRNEIAYQQAKSDFERASKLLEDKLITEKEYLAAKTDYERTQLAYEATGGKASVSGVSVSAPSGGYVKECLVSDGDFVEVGQPLMRLTQNKKLYLRAEVSERDYDKLGTISSAKFRPSYSERVYNLQDLDGRLVASGQTASANSSFIPVTFEFNNTGGVVPGSFAEIYLLTGRRENVISVPVSALTEEQGVYFVYVKIDDEGYLKKEVKLGATDGERVEVLSGLKPGDNLVTEGAIHVKLASATAAIPAHNHNH